MQELCKKSMHRRWKGVVGEKTDVLRGLFVSENYAGAGISVVILKGRGSLPELLFFFFKTVKGSLCTAAVAAEHEAAGSIRGRGDRISIGATCEKRSCKNVRRPLKDPRW